jgi:hypothetical protein
VRNNIDLTSDPDALFLNPWRDDGLRLLMPPDFFWRSVTGGVIEGFAVSAHPEINVKIRSFVTQTKRHKQFANVVETNTVPVVLDHASFRKSHVMAGGKLVLSGASATRLFNTFRRDNTADDPVVTLNAYLAQCRTVNKGRHIAIENTFIEPDLDFAAVCRNTFNYFHFLTESLSQLCVLDTVGFQGNIYFHFPNQEEKHRNFTAAFAEALFPEYAGRVFFERAPKDYDVVLSAFDLIGAIWQMPEDGLSGLTKTAPAGSAPGSVGFQPVLAMNSVSSAVLALRARGLAAVAQHDFSYLPKRFFVGRSDGQSRSRPLGGEYLMLEQLERFGFEYVVFEDLAPLEQIALMAQAEVMISHHGAGFANMMFAAPETYVIELGTLQTAQHRWADFWPLAHAARCRYISFFADFNSEDPLQEPHFATDGIVPTAVSNAAVSQIVAFILAVLGHTPEMQSAGALAVLGRRVMAAGAAPQALSLLEKHEAMAVENATLCLLRADCHKALDEPKSELVALEDAYAADPARWQTLVRIVWCANRCERPLVIRWALDHLAADFPDRHAAFVGNHDWVRFVA